MAASTRNFCPAVPEVRVYRVGYWVPDTVAGAVAVTYTRFQPSADVIVVSLPRLVLMLAAPFFQSIAAATVTGSLPAGTFTHAAHV